MNYCPFCMNELTQQDKVCPVCGRDPADYRPLPHTLGVGAVLNNRYLVGGVLGEGGFGITYIGVDTLLQVRVAIKEFFPNGMVSRNNTVSNAVQSISTESAKELFSKSRENFLREARTLAKFPNEPGIVAVRDFFEENHTVYIVMEYLDGITLKSYLKQVGRISPFNTVCLLMPVFRSLRKIHSKGLIHRDISPDNIMLVDEQVKLLDFGAAREFADERSLSVMLKHGYAPMEQYRRHGAQGAWTDVYAICATMYKCITGEVPPDAPDRVFGDTLKMPSEMGIETDPAFEEVLKKGLAVKPDDRIQSIDELLAALDAIPGMDIDEPYSSEPAKASKPDSSARQAEDSEKTIAGVGDSDPRLSEYIPHFAEAGEEQGRREAEPDKESEYARPARPAAKKKKSKTPVIIAVAAAAAAAAIALAVFLVIQSGKQDGSGKKETSSVSSSEASQALPTQTPEQPSETAAETAAETTAETSAETVAETAEPSTAKADDIDYPDLGTYLAVDETGFLTVDYSLFDRSFDEIKQLIPKGDVYVPKSHPVFGEGYFMLCLPIRNPFGESDDSYINSIDLVFKDGKLSIIQYEANTDYNNDIVDAATGKFGAPVKESKNTALWNVAAFGGTYQTCMTYYESDESVSSGRFTQRYYASGVTLQ